MIFDGVAELASWLMTFGPIQVFMGGGITFEARPTSRVGTSRIGTIVLASHPEWERPIMIGGVWRDDSDRPAVPEGSCVRDGAQRLETSPPDALRRKSTSKGETLA